MYRIYGMIGYFTASTYDQAQQIAINYEGFGNAPYIVSADGQIISDGSQAQRMIADAAKFWKAAQLARLQWWISLYETRGAQDFAADLALMQKELEKLKSPSLT